MKKIYYMDFDTSVSPQQKDLYMQFLSEERSKRVSRCKSSKAALECMQTGLFLRYGLEQLGNGLYEQVVAGENGKPYIRGNPFYFNISHSHRYVVLLISDAPCGIDVQKQIPYKEKLAGRVLHRGELAMLDSFLGMPPSALLTLFWSGKEAYLKYTGEGIRYAMSELNLSAYAKTWENMPAAFGGGQDNGRYDKDGGKDSGKRDESVTPEFFYMQERAACLENLHVYMMGFFLSGEYYGTICMETPFLAENSIYIAPQELFSYFSCFS